MNDAQRPLSGLAAASPLIAAVLTTALLLAAVILSQTVSVSTHAMFATATVTGCLALVIGVAWLWPAAPRSGGAPQRHPGLAVAALALAVAAGSAGAVAGGSLAATSVTEVAAAAEPVSVDAEEDCDWPTFAGCAASGRAWVWDETAAGR